MEGRGGTKIFLFVLDSFWYLTLDLCSFIFFLWNKDTPYSVLSKLWVVFELHNKLFWNSLLSIHVYLSLFLLNAYSAAIMCIMQKNLHSNCNIYLLASLNFNFNYGWNYCKQTVETWATLDLFGRHKHWLIVNI